MSSSPHDYRAMYRVKLAFASESDQTAAPTHYLLRPGEHDYTVSEDGGGSTSGNVTYDLAA